MHVLGMAAKLERHRPIVRAVLLSGEDLDDLDITYFEHIAQRQLTWEQQLSDLVDAFVGFLTDRNPDAAVVRAPDWSPKQRPKLETVQERSMVDGALVAACRGKIRETSYLTGQQIGAACGGKKEDAIAESAARFEQRYVEAGAAALAARAQADA
jgi:hypothetical protein